MWWTVRKSRKVGKGRVTVGKGTASYSRPIGKRMRVSVGKRGVRFSFRIFGIRFGF